MFKSPLLRVQRSELLSTSPWGFTVNVCAVLVKKNEGDDFPEVLYKTLVFWSRNQVSACSLTSVHCLESRVPDENANARQWDWDAR